MQEIEREREIERVKGAKSNNSLCNAGMPNGSRMIGEARKLRMLLTSVQQVKSFVGASESNNSISEEFQMCIITQLAPHILPLQHWQVKLLDRKETLHSTASTSLLFPLRMPGLAC